jgi:nucleotide-binding universal stress UspA family protein
MNIIVPVDFSSISLNAARFAAQMLVGNYGATMILYHAYEDEKKSAEAKAALQQLKDELLDEAILKIETRLEQSDDVVDSLERLARHLDAELIVMAITEKSKLGQMVQPSNSLKMIERNVCPVLVVPHDVKYNAIKNVALASDFQDVETSIPLVPVKKVLSILRPNLHIVNINSEIYVSLNEKYLAEREKMKEMFQEFHPEFYFITTFDFHETLRQFISDKKIDMVLIFPRTHSFINNLMRGNNTKKIVYESAIPVLAAHE